MLSRIRTAAVFAILVSTTTATYAENGFWGRPHPSAAACYEATRLPADDFARLSQGLVSCSRALRKGPHTDNHKATVHLNAALLHRALGDSASMNHELEQALALNPELAEALMLQALLAHREGDYRKAAYLYGQLLRDHAGEQVVAVNRQVLERNRDRVLATVAGSLFQGPSY